MNKSELVLIAKEALKNSYAPYSNFTVAAALEMTDGKIITGVNVENGSLGATNCAERSAIFAAVSQGYKKGEFLNLAIITHLDQIVPPCGICRQVMTEFFDENSTIILAKNSGEYEEYSLDQIVPLQFKLETHV